MDRNEAVQKLSKVARISVAYAEDLYDSFFPNPVVPQYVADWYEENKGSLDESIWEYLVNWSDGSWNDFKQWMYPCDSNNAIQTLVNMHQFGYEVDKEPRYTVKFNNLRANASYLKKDLTSQEYYTGGTHTDSSIILTHTRKELEEANFGWVFDCPGMEVKEVDDGND